MTKSIEQLTTIFQLAVGRGLPKTGNLLIVENNTLIHLRLGKILGQYMVSTAAKGYGEFIDSSMTPRGLHSVADFIGAGSPIGAVFKSREFTGEIVDSADWSEDVVSEKILSRILRLTGLDEKFNLGGDVDSFRRYIYIHGTNKEHQLGSRSSHGCIRMANSDIVELFSKINGSTTWCWIEPSMTIL